MPPSISRNGYVKFVIADWFVELYKKILSAHHALVRMTFSKVLTRRAFFMRAFFLLAALTHVLGWAQPLIGATGFDAYVTNLDSGTVSFFDVNSPPTFPTPAPTITVENGPGNIAISSDQTKAVVCNQTSNTLSIIDLTSSATTANLPVGNGPNDVVITPDGKKAYVCAAFSNIVSVIDLTTQLITTVIPVGATPTFLDVSPDGSKVCVSNQDSSSISIIDTATNTVITSVGVGIFPGDLAVTPDGQEVIVINVGSNTVSVVSLSSFSVVATINVQLVPFAVAITPDGTKACVCNTTSNTVSVIDLTTNTVIANVPVDLFPQAVSITPDSTKACVSNNIGNTVSMIDLSVPLPVVIATIPVGVFPTTSVVTPDGTKCCVCNAASDSISIIDLSSFAVINQVAVGSAPVKIAIRTVTLPPPPPPPSNPSAPRSFEGKVERKKKGKGILHTKWKKSLSSDVVTYEIFAFHKRIATISAKARLVFHKHLHSPLLFKWYLPKRYFHRLKEKYKIRAVSSSGLKSKFVHLKVKGRTKLSS
jgi:YVTN family beta-propeller protein